MSSLSRREFFIGNLAKKFHANEKVEKPEVVIGKIADFPIGEKKLLEKYQLTVESFSEGLRARSSSFSGKDKFYSIKANQLGELIVDRSKSWPAELVFSILTYEPTDFDSPKEDRS